MRVIFTDTFYWISLINPQDQWYPKVIKVSQSLGTIKLVTTDEVLTELLTFYANSGIKQRQRTVNFVKNIIAECGSKCSPLIGSNIKSDSGETKTAPY